MPPVWKSLRKKIVGRKVFTCSLADSTRYYSVAAQDDVNLKESGRTSVTSNLRVAMSCLLPSERTDISWKMGRGYVIRLWDIKGKGEWQDRAVSRNPNLYEQRISDACAPAKQSLCNSAQFGPVQVVQKGQFEREFTSQACANDAAPLIAGASPVSQQALPICTGRGSR